ncbi:DUF6500 family protein [Maribacter hydrothermalis]|nr:DUF6500 family protein [Maribacter hydrothermalis]
MVATKIDIVRLSFCAFFKNKYDNPEHLTEVSKR